MTARDPAGRSVPARILLVDDHPVVREGISVVVSRELDLEVVGQAADASEALDAAREFLPDLVLLDLALGTTDALDLIPRLKRVSQNTRVLVLSMLDERVYAPRCLQGGADGYLMKEEASATLLEAVRAVLGGRTWVSEDISRGMGVGGTGREVSASAVSSLSNRELQVFRMLGEGLSTREVAEALHLSVKTVESHRANIMSKLDVEGASHLVHRAVSWVQGEKGMD